MVRSSQSFIGNYKASGALDSFSSVQSFNPTSIVNVPNFNLGSTVSGTLSIKLAGMDIARILKNVTQIGNMFSAVTSGNLGDFMGDVMVKIVGQTRQGSLLALRLGRVS